MTSEHFCGGFCICYCHVIINVHMNNMGRLALTEFECIFLLAKLQ